MEITKPIHCKRIVSAMRQARLHREERWRTLKKYICPWRGVFEGMLEDSPTARQMLRFTHVASQACLRAASGMTSGMTPRNASWFKPDFIDWQMTEQPGARPWLDEIDRLMKDCLASGSFYQAIQSFNTDLIWAGCALLFAEEDDLNPLRYECQQVGSWFVELDDKGLLAAVARQLRVSVQDVADKFGEEKMSPGAKARLKDKPLERVRIWHLTMPREQGPHPFTCWWWEDGEHDKFLRVHGYYEMPFFFTCWHEGVTPYGIGPGDAALPDAMQIDKLERYKLLGLDKIVDPPTQAPYSLKGHVDLGPGAINYVADRSAITPIIDLAPFAASLGHLREEIATVSQRISQALMAEIFSSMPLEMRPAGMSATEFLERKREALQQLGPVISAYEPNVLTPLLFRTIQSIDRKALLPVPPQSLAQENLLLKMDFISPMANALRQSGAETTRALFQDVAQMAGAAQNMELLDKVDMDQMVDELAAGLGVPGSIIRADADVAAMRQQRAQAQAAQREMEAQAMQARTMQMEAGALGAQADAAAAMQAADAEANDGWL